MKHFSRCILILIIVTVLSGIGGYAYENKTIKPVYSSTTQLYVVPGEENEASVRAKNGGLNNDFMIIFKSNVVISEAQKQLGTTEDIAQYLSVHSPENSNIVEITCTNADKNTAKKYVDTVALTALKTTNIIPVKSIQILTVGTSDDHSFKPDLYRNTLMITGAGAAVCVLLEIIIALFVGAFKKPKDNSDDETEYERRYGKYAQYKPEMSGYIEAKSIDLGPNGARLTDNGGQAKERESDDVKLDDQGRNKHRMSIANKDDQKVVKLATDIHNKDLDDNEEDFVYDTEEFDPLDDPLADIPEELSDDSAEDLSEDSDQTDDQAESVVNDQDNLTDVSSLYDPMKDVAVSEVDLPQDETESADVVTDASDKDVDNEEAKETEEAVKADEVEVNTEAQMDEASATQPLATQVQETVANDAYNQENRNQETVKSKESSSRILARIRR